LRGKTKSNSYPELHGVDLADKWDESYCTYLGRSQGYAKEGNPYSNVWLNLEKSAEVIVLIER